MRAWVRLVCSAAVAAGLVVVPACGGGTTNTTAASKPRVGVVTNCTADFWTIAEAGAAKAGTDFDVDVTFRQPPANTVAAQKEIVDSLAQRGLSGLAVSVINPDEQTPDLRRLREQMNLLTMDNDAEGSERLAYIGIDNYEAGKAVGRLIKKALPAGGTLVLFIGNTTSANAKARAGGVLDELAGEKGAKGPKYGKFTLYKNEPLTDDTVESKALDNAKDALEKLKDTPNLCLAGLYAYNPKQIRAAAQAKGLIGKVTIVGFDEDRDTLAGIRAGEIVGTVVQDPFLYGYKSVEILAALARGDKSKLSASQSAVPYRVITKAGGPDETVNGTLVKNLPVDEFEKKLDADLASVKK